MIKNCMYSRTKLCDYELQSGADSPNCPTCALLQVNDTLIGIEGLLRGNKFREATNNG